MQLFPPAAQQRFFTDHSVSTILAPSGDERRHDVPMTHVVYPIFKRPSSLRFTDSGGDSITRRAAEFACHHSESSFSLYIDPMTVDCLSGSGSANHFDQPRHEAQKNSDEATTNRQRVLECAEFQTAGFETSGANTQWSALTRRGGVVRPTATLPRPSPALPPGAPTNSPQLELESEDLWRRFDQLTTEMVITKSGRSVSKLVHTT